MNAESRKLSFGLSLIVALSLLLSVTPVLGVILAYPDPDFTASPTRGYAPLTVQFADRTEWEELAEAAFPLALPKHSTASTPYINGDSWSCVWDFGDGSTQMFEGMDKSNPSHVYTEPGNYTVTLTWTRANTLSIVPTRFPGLPTANQVDEGRDVFEITKQFYIRVLARPEEKDKETPPEPADLGVSYLNIDPAQVLPNQEVTISANICNSGEERGTKTVSLMVSGEAVASQSVGVSGGSCQQVVFTTSRAVPGTYQVAIDGMTGEFSVLAPRTVTRNVPSQQQTGLGTAGIIAIIAVIVVLVAALIMVFKKD